MAARNEIITTGQSSSPVHEHRHERRGVQPRDGARRVDVSRRRERPDWAGSGFPHDHPRGHRRARVGDPIAAGPDRQPTSGRSLSSRSPATLNPRPMGARLLAIPSLGVGPAARVPDRRSESGSVRTSERVIFTPTRIPSERRTSQRVEALEFPTNFCEFPL